MFGYVYKTIIKKSFWDYIDNMLAAVMINIGYFILLTAEASFILMIFESRMTPSEALPVICIIHLILFIYTGIISHYLRDISEGKTCTFKGIKRYIRDGWFRGLIFGIFSAVLTVILFFAVPFYIELGGIAGAAGSALLTWFFVILALAAQYYFPILSRTSLGPFKIIKRSFYLLLDNILLTVLLPFIIPVQLIFTMLTVFLLPGVSGILLLFDAAWWVLERKYEYIRENPGTDKKNIPWQNLLAEERARIGNRRLLDTLFPFGKK